MPAHRPSRRDVVSKHVDATRPLGTWVALSPGEREAFLVRACVYNEYGPPEVLHIEEVPKPAPRVDEVLVRVRATTVNFGDLIARNFKSVTPRQFGMPFLFWLLARLAFGLSKPRQRILGSEFAGDVESVGAAVTRFKVGDAVFGYLGERMGAYAEYVCVPERAAVAHKPSNLSYEEAATVPYGAVMALGLLRHVTIKPGERVLILGASGAIGSAALQLVRHAGAEVTGVCGAPRMAFVKALGADRVIDYDREDVTQGTETYDVILDVLGKSSFARCERVLKPDGTLLYASFKTRQLAQMLWTSIVGGKRVACTLAPGSLADLMAVKNLVEAGKLTTLIDRRFPLAETAEAHRYALSGRKQARVVITLG